MPFTPANLTSAYLPGFTWGVPAFCVNGSMDALPVLWTNTVQNSVETDVQYTPLRDSAGNNCWQILHNNNSNYGAPPNDGFIPGDSGHVMALDVNGALDCLATGLSTPFGAPAAYATITAINSTMAASPISSAYQVTVKDLSAFPTY